nr:hypothetical protein CFP56_05685 [Quercus suber]
MAIYWVVLLRVKCREVSSHSERRGLLTSVHPVDQDCFSSNLQDEVGCALGRSVRYFRNIPPGHRAWHYQGYAKALPRQKSDGGCGHDGSWPGQ